MTDDPTPGPYVRPYDLRNDPGEFHNIAAKEPRLVADSKTPLLERFRSTYPNAAAEPRAGLDEVLDWYPRPRDA